MKNVLVFLMMGLMTAVGAGAQKARPAAEFVLHMPDGSTRQLSSYKGKVVVFAMMQTGCPHCQHFAQQLSVYQQEYGPKGVQVVGVVFDSGAKAGLAKFRDQFVRGFPIAYSDENAVMSWLQQPLDQGYFVPIVAFINRRGMVESQHLGDDILFQDPDGNIRHKLDALLKR